MTKVEFEQTARIEIAKAIIANIDKFDPIYTIDSIASTTNYIVKGLTSGLAFQAEQPE